MTTEIIKIGSRIEEQYPYLNNEVENAIINKSKIHFTAPVGTGKTTFAIKLIEKYSKDYQVVLLEPQISITKQVEKKLVDKGYKPIVFNSKTKGFLVIDKILNRIKSKVFLSTIDSAYLLFETKVLDPEKTIVLIDETHSLLQGARKDFDRTVRTINNIGCPVIGFTATKSTWVLEEIFNMDKSIVITATKIPKKIIKPIRIKGCEPAKAVAHNIKGRNQKKVIIWTETKKNQKQIEKEILKLSLNLKISILNADTREAEEKDTWDHLIENDELPEDIDIAIINSVAMAGVNINNTNIEAQYMVDKFDPFAFRQYLGRTRNYHGTIEYIFKNYGPQEAAWKDIKTHKNYQNRLEKTLNLFTPEQRDSLISMNEKLSDMFTETETGEVVINKCMVASHSYQTFRSIISTAMLNIVGAQDPSLEIKDIVEFVWEKKDQNKKQKAIFRRKMKDKLPAAIIKSARYIASLMKFHAPGQLHDDIRNIIKKSTTDKTKSKRENKLYIPRTKKKHLLEAIKLAEQAGVGIQRVILAAKKYVDFGKSDKALNSILSLSNAAVTKHLGAEVFFNTDLVNNSMIRTLLDEYQKIAATGVCKTHDYWIDIANAHIEYLNGIESITKKIWNYALIKKRSKTKNRDNGYIILEVVRTYDAYVKANNLDNYF